MKRIVLLHFFLVACESRPVPPTGTEALVLAKINDQQITDKQLLANVDKIQLESPAVLSTHIQKKELLQQMINIELLYREALKRELDKSVAFKIKLAETYVDELGEKARQGISDQSVLKFYEQKKSQIDQVSASHILLRISPAASREDKLARLNTIERFRKELLQNPENFSVYAKQHSEDATGDNGGELGYFTRGMMVKSFSDAAFKLKKIGDISEVVKTEFGYHLIRLTGDRRGLEQHKQNIRDQLLYDTQSQILKTEVAKLRKQYDIEIYEENLLKLSPLPSVIGSNPDKTLPQNMNPPDTRDP